MSANREQRRRANRARRRQTVDLGGGRRATGLGTVHAARPMADPPPKEQGRHRWIVTAAYTLTASQAAAAAAGAYVELGPAMLIHLATGCLDCEQEYEACRLSPCPAGDSWGAPPEAPKPLAGVVHSEPGSFRRTAGGLQVPCEKVEAIALRGDGQAVCAACLTPVRKINT
jgi:hypothetical protein